MKPRLWKHKTTGQLVKAMPWFDIPDNFLDDLPGVADAIRNADDEWKERKFKIGCLVQVGWLIENGQGVWFGVGPKAKESFDDIGECKPEEQVPASKVHDDEAAGDVRVQEPLVQPPEGSAGQDLGGVPRDGSSEPGLDGGRQGGNSLLEQAGAWALKHSAVLEGSLFFCHQEYCDKKAEEAYKEIPWQKETSCIR